MSAFAASPLAHAPEVTTFLNELGFGTLRDDRVTSFGGRNEIWAGVTTMATPVFVKKFAGEASDVGRRLARTAAMDSALRDHPGVNTPGLRGIDHQRRLAVFELLDGAVTAADLVAVTGLGDEAAFEAGAMVGALHGLPWPTVLVEDTSEPPMPPTRGLDAMPLDSFLALSAAELEVWRILHNDLEVAGAIRRVREQERRCVRTVVHGDLRLDQLLQYRGRLFLTDWEESRIADPARDVGAFVGECLYRGVLGMVSGDLETSEDQVLRNGAREFAALVPLIAAFWAGYRGVRPEDADLAVRAVAFAGWHMFDRAWASGHHRARLSPVQRAAAGVGRTALIKPATLTATLGLGVPG